MNNEAQLNTIIKNSIINSGGWAYKINDPQKSSVYTSNPNPFDGFGIYQGNSLYWEAKYMSLLHSFSLNSIQDHQIKNLVEINTLNPNSLCWIILGVHIARGNNRVYVFKDVHEIARRRANKLNIKKKELESLSYLSVHKDLIDIKSVL